MAWRIEFLPQAARELAKVDTADRQRILRCLRDRLAPREDPRSLGEALRGPELGKYWRYRLGRYRIICDIRDDRVVILVVRVGHRREVDGESDQDPGGEHRLRTSRANGKRRLRNFSAARSEHAAPYFVVPQAAEVAIGVVPITVVEPQREETLRGQPVLSVLVVSAEGASQ